MQLIAGALPRVEILGLTVMGAAAVAAAASAIAAGGDESAAAQAALDASRGKPNEERLCADLVALRDKAKALLEALPVEEHLRFCDACWHADELACAAGQAIRARVERLERALGW